MNLIILSLKDIMRRFDLLGLSALLTRLRTAQATCENLKNAPNQNMDWAFFVEQCENCAKYCNSVGFDHSSRKAFYLMSLLKSTPFKFNFSSIEAEFRSLEQDIFLDMLKHKFVQVDHRLLRYFEAKDLFGKKVSNAFPKSLPDISDAGDCLSVGANTAAVFHLMRVVEWGLRAIAYDVGLLDVVMDKKSGKTVPVEFSQWERILTQLRTKVDAKVDAISKGTEKQKAQEFYYSAMKDVDGFKEAWRNHVMHSRRIYSCEDALAIISHVERFMESLAEYGIRESPRRKRAAHGKP